MKIDHKTIAISILAPLIILGIFLYNQLIEIELFSALSALMIAVSGYIYQSGENKRLQDLQYKRETYANLMSHLSIFKETREDKSDVEKRELTKMYFRSWAETSDEVNIKLSKYFEAYINWTKAEAGSQDKGEKDIKENEAFVQLTAQIKKEINPHSDNKFVIYFFK